MNKKAEVRRPGLGRGGFSLVELLVAVMILAIIVAPLLHSFVTASVTNAKAKTTLRATTTAENYMEEFVISSLEELTAKYHPAYDETTGKYEFHIEDTSTPVAFEVEIRLDPAGSPDPAGIGSYEEINSQNVIDLNSLNTKESGIFTMGPGYDAGNYRIYSLNSYMAAKDDPSQYTRKDDAFFEKNLDRTIRITLYDKGMASDKDGNPVQLARVSAAVEYEWKGAEKVVADEFKKITDTQEIFDNGSSKVPLKNIYLLYTPRLEANINGHKQDVIVIENSANIPCNVYVVRQYAKKDDEDDGQYQIRIGKYRGNITVVENPASVGSFGADTEAAIRLFTNLHADFPTPPTPAALRTELKYQNTDGTKSAVADTARDILDTRAADGRTLSNKDGKDRLFEMEVTVRKKGESENLILMTGSKLD